MATPESVVNSFLSAPLESFDDMCSNYERYLAENLVWHTGTMLCNSRAEALEILERGKTHYDMAYWTNDILHQASNGNIVFNERVDHIFRHDGSKLAATYVCAIFEVDGDRITKWRDYYDPTELRGLVSALHAEMLRDRRATREQLSALNVTFTRVGIVLEDLEAVVARFGNELGLTFRDPSEWNLDRRDGEGRDLSAPFRLAYAVNGAATLRTELQSARNAYYTEPGFDHVGLWADDLEAQIAELSEKG